MNKRMLQAIGTLAMCLALGGCVQKPEEQALRETISTLQTAVERHDADGIEEVLAADFIGSGGLDRAGARRLAGLMFFRHRDIGATLGPLEVDMQGNHASVRFTVVVTGGRGRALPDAARVYRVESGWRFMDGEWRLTSADWEPGD